MTRTTATVLIVEDEPQVRRFLRATLVNHSYRIVETETAEGALREATTCNPDIVLLDLGLPDSDGIELIGRLREWLKAPVIVLSARDQEQEKIRALDQGADDYLTKPFGAGELLARIRVALRHAAEKGDAASEPVFSLGDLQVDFAQRMVKVGDKPVHLTPTEYKLLSILVRYGGKVITHRQLLKEVWGPTYADHTNYLRVFMAQLRHKLEDDPARPRYLLTEPGVGYRIRPQ